MWIQTALDITVAAMHSVRGDVRIVQKQTADRDRMVSIPKTLNKGILHDGRPYVVYRFMLYADDFKESSSPYSLKSAGGVYLLPLGLSTRSRASSSSVHVLSLTPPGTSTNEVLLEIVPDIVNGVKHGIEGVTPLGSSVVIFIDPVGYIADYPAASGAVDVLGHSADSPCTHCNFRKFKENTGSSNGYTTNIDGLSSAHLRCAERHNALRMANISDMEANILGMKPNSFINDHTCPLHVLHRELVSIQPSIQKTPEGAPVVTGLFDPFRSNVVAPDHLLTGIARNILDICFKALNTDQRDVANIVICTALTDKLLIQQRTVFNEKKIRLHAMSLSAVYCVLLVAGPVFHALLPNCSAELKEGYEILHFFQQLVALTIWLPSKSRDGDRSYRLPRLNGGRTYIAGLQEMADHFISQVDEFCKRHPEYGSVLNKPNLHRLLELYHHTIPSFGHAINVLELLFEAAHQPLKRCISKSKHHSAEVSAVEHCLGNDWQRRVALLESFLREGISLAREGAANGLRRLLLGQDINHLS